MEKMSRTTSRETLEDAPFTFSGRPMSPQGKASTVTIHEESPFALNNMKTLIANHNRRVKMRRAFDLIAPIIPALILAASMAVLAAVIAHQANN